MTYNLDIEMASIKKKKSELLNSKRDHEAGLRDIKLLIRTKRGTMSSAQYEHCCNGQQKHNRAMREIESQLSAIKMRMHEISDIKFKDKVSAISIEAILEKRADQESSGIDSDRILNDLESLRAEYQRFSADATRVSSMRRSASEFAIRLEDIINKNRGNPSPEGETSPE